MDVDASVVRAMNTSGRSVVFAGLTVVVALLGLLLLRISVLSGMGIATGISIAAVAASVLINGGHDGRTYDLTGLAALTPADRIAVLSQALGRDLTFQPQPDDEARQEPLRATGPEYVESFFLSTPAVAWTNHQGRLPWPRSPTGIRAPSTSGRPRTLRPSRNGLIAHIPARRLGPWAPPGDGSV